MTKLWAGIDTRVVRLALVVTVVMVITIAIEAVGLMTSNDALWVPAVVVFTVGWIVLAVCIVIATRQAILARRTRPPR